jgi:uncharacterized protein (DUF2267 family)
MSTGGDVMPKTHAVSLMHSVEKTNQWLDEVAEQLGRPEDRRYALGVVRAVLHALRDRLPVDDAAHLAAQLPELLRGVYYEGWRPSTTPHAYHDLAGFLDRVGREAGLAGGTEAAYATEAVVHVMKQHVTAGELAKVRAALPRPVAAVLREPGDTNLREPGDTTLRQPGSDDSSTKS